MALQRPMMQTQRESSGAVDMWCPDSGAQDWNTPQVALTEVVKYSVSCCRVFPGHGLGPSKASRGAPPLSGQDLRAGHPKCTFVNSKRRG